MDDVKEDKEYNINGEFIANGYNSNNLKHKRGVISMAKVALITGITGQDGSYLAEFLLEKGYEVHGITRRASISNTARIDHLMGKITLHDGDLSDSSSLIRIISLVNPDEIYNFGSTVTCAGIF